jgi:photosystem II stability/assembly factor-like uncharacterized protein
LSFKRYSKMKTLNYLALLSLVLCVSVTYGKSKQKADAYNWKSVQIVGGGFVDGIVFHPTEKNLRYARTDMGGAYRWEEAEQRWIPLLDWVSYEDNNLMGVESIALDPSNPDKLYLSCGTYTSPQVPNGEVLISNNRGKTFERVKVPFKMGGNENGRGNGERMAVDPKNGNILYLGTRNDGLWRSADGGKTWSSVKSFPDIKEVMPEGLDERQKRMWGWNMKGCGVNVVVFDPTSSTENGCQTIYVAVSIMNSENIFRSADGGKTWNAIAGQPQQYRPTHAVLATDGNLFISYGDNPGPGRMTNGAVWKLNTKTDEWTDITPDKPDSTRKFGYAAVSVDASNPQVLIASTHYRPGETVGDEIFRSIDGGKTWKGVFANGTVYDYSKAPYVQHTGIHWMFDIEINPFNPNHAIFTIGFGGFETFNLTNVDKGLKTNWSVYTTGIEETVPLELCSPPAGAQLITGIGDYGGFVHWDLDKPAPEGNFDNPRFGNTDGVTCAELKPEIVVRVGVAAGNNGGSNIGYSTDFGKTWKGAKNPTENSRHGHISVSADGNTWIWTPERTKPYFTIDKGETWTAIENLKENTRVVADRVNPKKFYAIDLREGLQYTSVDGGRNFVSTQLNLAKGKVQPNSNRGDSRGGQDRIYAVPGFENELWIAAFDGLYHSEKADAPFVLQPKVSEIHGFGFGKAAPGKDYPALYLIGIVDGIRGVYRSTDKAKSWVRINDDQHQWGLLLHVTGDPKKYGRVYVGTHGRGAVYGDPMD